MPENKKQEVNGLLNIGLFLAFFLVVLFVVICIEFFTSSFNVSRVVAYNPLPRIPPPAESPIPRIPAAF